MRERGYFISLYYFAPGVEATFAAGHDEMLFCVPTATAIGR
jgi:hypothetical protein